jgi:formylglycine-generating enzyme required for sulfatase activity/tRNA A-37 threonylcarbamoyl transferase component Bud32
MMGDFGPISHIPPGTLLAGRYEIQRVIGQGGMGIVYLAKDKHLEDELRAIKTIRSELLTDAKGLTSLKREAMASMKLAHHNIVRIFNYEEDQGISFIVMEYVEGKTLAEVIAQRGRFAEAEFLPIAGQLCAALDYAHRQGIVHQDIKPANVFLNASGEAKLADFGIARIVKDTTTRLTGKMASGTLIYMSPEALRGEKPAALSDIYSLGITFYEMLSGEPPFVRGDITWQHMNQPPQAMEGISELLNRAVLKGLEKEPENRPSSAGEYWNLIGGEVERSKRAEEDRRKKEEEEKQRRSEEELKVRMEAAHREREEEERRKRVEERQRLEEAERKKAEEDRRRAEEREAEYRRRRQVERPSEKAEGRTIWSKPGFWIAVVVAFILILAIAITFTTTERGEPKPEEKKSEEKRAEDKVPDVKGMSENEAKEAQREAADSLNIPVEIKDTVGITFKLIPAGSFVMGASPGDSDAYEDESPRHQVEITKAFYIGVYEVTQAQWQEVMGTTVRQQRDKADKDWPMRGEGHRYPIYYVNWDEAREFCRKLSAREGVTYRLPTEAEWEYACRAGTTTKYYWGNNMNDDYAWYDDNSGNETHEVGRRSPNAWGLYDMSGNVWEWCSDWYGANYYSSSPRQYPKGPSSGVVRVLRGGCWSVGARVVRSSLRLWVTPVLRYYNYGFRIVRDVE